MSGNVTVSPMDEKHLELIRQNVSDFIGRCADTYGGEGLLLDIAPQDHEGAKPYFISADIRTLDIDQSAGATYTTDICSDNSELIPDDTFDWVVCTEVLEHTEDPFAAANEIYRILKPGGLVFISTPFNFRIHGPLPDCWRFTVHGLKALLKRFEIITIEELKTEGRDLMPIQYTVVARKSMA